jgi:hypothetical protein
MDEVNPFEEACREWMKACSCAQPAKPWECAACTEGFHQRLAQLVEASGVPIAHTYGLAAVAPSGGE